MRSAAALLCLALPGASAVQAQSLNSFELEFSRDRIPLTDQSLLDADGLGIRYSEGSTLPLRLTLALGRQVASHIDDAVALGYQPDGLYIGINLTAASPRWHSLQLGADFGYSYHSASQAFNQQQLEINWHRAEARGWLALHINDALKLHGCAIAVNIDGSQTLNGATPSRLDFKNERRSGYCGGIELETGDGGYIGLEAESRHQRGGRLYFGKRYGFF